MKGVTIMIYTSYFAKLKSLPSGITPIAICYNTPIWYMGPTYKKLAPTYNMIRKYKQDHDTKEYTNKFEAQILSNLNVHEVIQDLEALGSTLLHWSGDICLICYEKSSDFCHRHLVADWFRQAGYECEEWY